MTQLEASLRDLSRLVFDLIVRLPDMDDRQKATALQRISDRASLIRDAHNEVPGGTSDGG